MLVTAEHVRALINKLIKHAPTFVHEYHTCMNEVINSWWTKDVPKAKYFPSTYLGRAWFAVLRRNLGGHGRTQEALWRELNLPIATPVQAHWELINHQQTADQQRKSSWAMHK